ncbi:MAG: hypothetical protein LUD22_01535 [Coprobacillus sp.]|nr:hypothetical protein [Coprobacillus sp.]
MLKLVTGYLYVISDQFFIDVNDPYLVKNHPGGLRPYYLAIYDSSTDLYWMIPLSSKVDKYKRYYRKTFYKWTNSSRSDAKEILSKFMLGMKIVHYADRESVLLFQDMFPVSRDYIVRYYLINHGPFTFDEYETQTIVNQAREVISLLKNGFKFVSTQPDINRLEKILLDRKLK